MKADGESKLARDAAGQAERLRREGRMSEAERLAKEVEGHRQKEAASRRNAQELLVHPEEARAGLARRGHADSTWSCVNRLQTGSSACPPACCTTPSASAAMTTSAPSTRTA